MSELKNDRFLLHFQPIVSLHGDTDERYEVRFDEMASLRHVHLLPKAATIAILGCIGAFVVFAVWGVTSAGG